MTKCKKYVDPSLNPLEAIEKVSYAGQNPMMRQYREGYEFFLGNLPVMTDADPDLEDDMQRSNHVMSSLADKLISDEWPAEVNTPDGKFHRTIIAIEESENGEGKELVVAQWGNGFSSPVHGHADGFLYEHLLSGKMIVNTYRLIIGDMNLVKLVRSDLYTDQSLIASKYTKSNPNNSFKRQALIHNFTSYGYSASLHYVPEHTRDGRDNRFKVKWFDDVFNPKKEDFTQISSKDGMYLRKGDVCLVDSQNVPEYGQHYIVITGAPVKKAHGLRPQDVAMVAPTSKVLNEFEFHNGLKLLKLNKDLRDNFLKYHNIEVTKEEVTFPEA